MRKTKRKGFNKLGVLSIPIFLLNLPFTYAIVHELSGQYLSQLISLRITLVLLLSVIISYLPFVCMEYALNSIRGFSTTIVVCSAILFVLCTFIADTLIRYSNIKTAYVFSSVMVYITIIFFLYYIFNKYLFGWGTGFIKEVVIELDKQKKDGKRKKENKEKGDFGEKNVVFQLNHLEHSDEAPFKIINDKSFSFKGHVQAQLDHIVICRKGVFLLETKNHSSILIVAKSGDWLTRNKNGKLTPYLSEPTSQCTRHHTVIRNILYSNGYAEAPIVDLIVLANEAQYVCNADYSKHQIVKVAKLLEIFTITNNESYPDVLSNEQVEGIYALLEASVVPNKKYGTSIPKALYKKMVPLPITYALFSSVLVFLLLLGFSSSVLISDSFFFETPKTISAASNINIFSLGSNRNNDTTEIPLEALDQVPDYAVQSDKFEDFEVAHEPTGFYWNIVSHKTYLQIKDGKKTILSAICSEGTKVYFYSDKTIAKINPDGSVENFTVENDILNLEVANNYTEVYHEGELRKSLRQFRYNIVENKILK